MDDDNKSKKHHHETPHNNHGSYGNHKIYSNHRDDDRRNGHGDEEEEEGDDGINYHSNHDDTSEVHDDANLLNHIPWNHLFPKNSYLPDEESLHKQHHTVMGDKFYHDHRDLHADVVFGNQFKSEGFINTHGGGTPYEKFIHNHGQSHVPEDHDIDPVRHLSPYGHHTPYLGGDMNRKSEQGEIFGAVHGDLCVGKRDSLCHHDDDHYGT